MKNLRLYSDIPFSHEDFSLELWTGGELKNLPYIKRVGGRVCECDIEDQDNGYKFYVHGASKKTLDILKECDFVNTASIFSTTSPTLNAGTIIYTYAKNKKTNISDARL